MNFQHDPSIYSAWFQHENEAWFQHWCSIMQNIAHYIFLPFAAWLQHVSIMLIMLGSCCKPCCSHTAGQHGCSMTAHAGIMLQVAVGSMVAAWAKPIGILLCCFAAWSLQHDPSMFQLCKLCWDHAVNNAGIMLQYSMVEAWTEPVGILLC